MFAERTGHRIGPHVAITLLPIFPTVGGKQAHVLCIGAPSFWKNICCLSSNFNLFKSSSKIPIAFLCNAAL